MNDEIREILQTLDGIASGDWIQMLPKEANKLLDYITNLQQENKRLQQNNYDMQREMAMCWQKIDKTVEYIKNESYLEEGYMIPVVEEKPLLNILQNGSDASVKD